MTKEIEQLTYNTVKTLSTDDIVTQLKSMTPTDLQNVNSDLVIMKSEGFENLSLTLTVNEITREIDETVDDITVLQQKVNSLFSVIQAQNATINQINSKFSPIEQDLIDHENRITKLEETIPPVEQFQ